MNEDLTLMQVLANISSLVSLEQSIDGIFAPATSLNDILDLVIQEITDIFLEELASEDLRNAISELQTVQQFLAINYHNAKKVGETNAQLYTTLTDPTVAPNLQAFQNMTNLMQGWATDFQNSPDASQQNVACQSISFCLLAYLYTAMIYKEKSMVNDAVTEQRADWANMQSYAGLAITNIKPILTAMVAYRESGITEATNTINGPLDIQYEYNDSYLNYEWDTGPGGNMSNYEYVGTARTIISYIDNGSDSKWQLVNFSVIGSTATAVHDFGKWHLNAANTLSVLENIQAAPCPY